MSYSLVLGAAGGIVGAFVGQPALGYAAGSILGAQLDPPPEGENVEGPRLNDLRTPGTSYGTPIPKIWGSARLQGRIVWSAGIKETATTEEVGGKGGNEGKSEVTTYTYTASFRVLLCEGTITGIRTIFADNKVIWRNDATLSFEDRQGANKYWSNMRIYKGDLTQGADTLEEATVGAGNSPAYRGVCTIVFDKLLLAKFGNRIPNIEAEVVRVGTITTPTLSLYREIQGADFNAQVPLTNPRSDEYWTNGHISNDGVLRFYAIYLDAGDPTELGSTDSVKLVTHTTQNGRWIDTDITSHKMPRFPDLFQVGRPLSTSLHFGSFQPLGTTNDPATSPVSNIISGTTSETIALLINWNNTFYNNTTLVFMFSDDSQRSARVSIVGQNTTNFSRLESAITVGNRIYVVVRYTTGAIFRLGVINKSAERFQEPNIFINNLAPAGNEYKMIGADQYGWYALIRGVGIQWFDHESGAPLGTYAGKIPIATTNATGIWRVKTNPEAFWVGLGTNWYYEDQDGASANMGFGGTIQVSDQYRTAYGNGLFWTPDQQEAPDGHMFGALSEGITRQDEPLANVITDILNESGIPASKIDVSGVTGNVQGFVRTRRMSARELLGPLRTAYFIDMTESGGKVKFFQRGTSSVATVTKDDVAAQEEAA